MSEGKTTIAYEYIKQKIIRWELLPMSDISEEKIQTELGLSRTPVREAILRLEKEGFLYVYPRKGTIVAEVSRDLTEEIYQMRLLTEPFINESASHTISRSWLKDIRRRLFEPPADYSERKLREYFMELDWELHSTILENCGNRFLRNEMRNVYDHNQRIRLKASNPGSGYDHSVQEHIRIIDAMLDQDSVRILEESKKHIIESKKITDGAL